MYPTSIHHWLQNIQHDASPTLKRTREQSDADADTNTDTTVMSSPAKRARPSTPESLLATAGQLGPPIQEQQQQQIPGAQDATPTQMSYRSVNSGSAVFPPREVLVPRSPRKQNQSPERVKVKTVPDLRYLLAVPVEYTFPTDVTDSFQSFPSARILYRRLLKVENSFDILPEAMRTSLEATVSKHAILPHMWTRTTVEVATVEEGEEVAGVATAPAPGPAKALEPSPIDFLQAQMELESIKEVVEDSRDAISSRGAEAHWNSTIHHRVMKMALKRGGAMAVKEVAPSVKVMNVTSAQMAGPFRPRLANSDNDEVASLATTSTSASGADSDSFFQERGGSSSHKMVDFAMCLDLKPDQENGGVGLADLVKRFLARQPSGEQWINAMSYAPVKGDPAAVFVETKSGSGKSEDANVQLGICLAGWHNRMRRILDQTKRKGNAAHVLTVPAIFVFEADWEVVFVVDGRSLSPPKDEIHIVGPSLKLGNTCSVIGMYRLLAGLRCITNWMDIEFRKWITQLLKDTFTS